MDIKTLMFISAAVSLVCSLLITALWLQNRKKMEGIHLWVIQFFLITLTMILVMLRGYIPDFFSMVVSNSLSILGMILILIGLEKFLGKSGRQIHNFIYLIIFAGIHCYYSIIIPDLAARNLNLSFGILFLSVQISWLMFYRVGRNDRKITSMVGWVYLTYCAANVLRIIEYFIVEDHVNDFFQPNNFDAIFVVAYALLLIWLAAALGMMINKRLLVEIANEDEKFSKAFFTSPYAITITRAENGKIIDVNDGFLKITGYNRDEVIGNTTIDLHLWKNRDDRDDVVKLLSEQGFVNNLEYAFVKKNGEELDGLFSAAMITTDDKKYILSSISDVTKIKNNEKELSKRLAELHNVNKYMVGRELKMLELKKQIAELENSCRINGKSR